jgi:hypothetical protein
MASAAARANQVRAQVEGKARREADAARVDAETAALPRVVAAYRRDALARSRLVGTPAGGRFQRGAPEDELTVALRAVPLSPGAGSELAHLAALGARPR